MKFWVAQDLNKIKKKPLQSSTAEIATAVMIKSLETELESFNISGTEI
jgi:hypothetical protein